MPGADTPHGYYETYWSEDGFKPARVLPSAVQSILSEVAVASADCLDVGCGDGRTAGTWLQGRVGNYQGVDVSQAGIAAAQAHGLDARVIESASNLPFGAAQFDLVVCFEVLEHLLDPLQAAREMLRTMRPSGTLVLSVPNAAYWQRRAELATGTWNPYGDPSSIAEPWRDPHIRFFTRRGLTAMLLRAGAREVAVGGHEGVLYSETVPVVRRLRGLSKAQPLYDAAQRRWPAVFADRLHAVVRA